MPGLVQIERLTKRDFHSRISELNEQKKKKRILESQLPLELLSKHISERIVTDASTPVPECVTCGLCCSFPLIVPVTLRDSERLKSYCDILLDDSEHEIVVDRVLPRGEDGRCVNLRGTLGQEIGCTIYEDRPRVCRDFDAGSDRCHAYRRMYGFEPPLPEREVAIALERLQARERSVFIEDAVIVHDATIHRTVMTLDHESDEQTVAVQLKIIVFLDDETPHELHSFESGKEVWFESEFLGLSFEEAKELISSRTSLQV